MSDRTRSRPDVVYDLRRFADALPDDHRDLRKRVRRWIDSHSIVTDLRLARDGVASALRLNRTKRESLELAVMALMQSAVMAYARGLERHSEHRGKVSVKGQFSSEQLRMHERLCHLRDEALAHFGPAGTGRPWNEDFALLLQTGVYWQPVISSKRSLFDEGFAEALLAHLSAVEARVFAEVEKRRAEFQSLFDERLMVEEVGDALEAARLTAEEANRFQPVFDTPRQGRQIVRSRGD